jgi:folate-binding protein YgfZ
MHPDWARFLASRGAGLAEGVVRDFGDAQRERAAAAAGSVVADLSQFGVLAAGGADARPFLHGQLSCDVEGLADGTAAYGAYCTAKGRVLANFLLWPEAGTFFLVLPRTLVPDLQKRLQRFVLRSKVALEDRSEALVLLGAAGPAAAGALAKVADAVPVPIPAAPLQTARGADITTIALDRDRFAVVASVPRAPALWDRLAAVLAPVGTPCWEWLEIARGLPWITRATQDQFVPQMANLELIGGVNFRKGCYPGQEIVARTQYLGTPKRRLFLAHVEVDAPPAPGAPLVTDGGERSAGTVVNAAPAPGGGFDLLAVVQTASAGSATVRLGSPTGPALRFRPLPYAVS